MAEAENGKRQVYARTLDSPSARLGIGGVGSASSSVPTSTVQGVVPSRQPGHVPGHWRSDTPPTPRRVPSDSAMPQKLDPFPAPTPNRTSIAPRATLATQANPDPARPIMGPVIVPVRQTPSASGSMSTGSSSRKPSCVPFFVVWDIDHRVTVVVFISGWVVHGRYRQYNRSRRLPYPVRRRRLRLRRYNGCKSCRRRLCQRISDRCAIFRKRSAHGSKRPIS